MRSSILLTIAVLFGFVVMTDAAFAIADVVQHVLFPQTGDRVTRRQLQPECTDEQLQNLTVSFPQDCFPLGGNLDTTGVEQLEPMAVAKFAEIFCQPRCGNPLVAIYKECFDNSDRKISEFILQLCAENSQGNRCYSTEVTSAINATFLDSNCSAEVVATSCSPRCRNVLQATTTAIECCINIVNVGGLFNVTSTIQESCGISIPGLCGGSTLGEPVTSTPMTASATVPPTSQPPDCGSVDQLLNSLPRDCAENALVNAGKGLEEQNATAFASSAEIFCQPSCGNPFIDYYEACFGDVGTQFGEFLLQLCAKNSQGNRCYSADVVSAINTTSDCSAALINNTSCSPSCQRKINAAITEVDCCINLVHVGGPSNAATYNFIQDDCGINLPGLCSGSTLHRPSVTSPPTMGTSSGSVTLTINIFVGVFAVLLSLRCSL